MNIIYFKIYKKNIMDEIYLKTIKVIEKHMNTQGGVVCEIGNSYAYPRYVYADVGLGLGKRQSIDNAKVLFMNDCMNILLELKNKLESPIETQDEYIDCDKFTCGPGCSCGSEKYQQLDQMFLDDDIQ